MTAALLAAFLADIELTMAGAKHSFSGGRGVVESQMLHVEASGFMMDVTPTAHRQFEKWHGKGVCWISGTKYELESIQMSVSEVLEVEFSSQFTATAVGPDGRKTDVSGTMRGIVCRLPVNKSKQVFIIIGFVVAAIPVLWLVTRLVKKS
jgi:hypothetical protein